MISVFFCLLSMAWEGYVMGFESRVEEIETRDAPIV